MPKNTWGGRRLGAGRPAGYESEQRTTGWTTKVVRVPAHWDVLDIHDGLESLLSVIEQLEERIEEARAHTKDGVLTDRRWQLIVRFFEDLKKAFPRSYFEKGRWRQTGAPKQKGQHEKG